MAVDDVEPTASNITSGAYSISRPLLVISKGELSLTEKGFSVALTDSKAMEIVEKMGFVPAR
jgi:phosphate transport system substrate-binding protein